MRCEGLSGISCGTLISSTIWWITQSIERPDEELWMITSEPLVTLVAGTVAPLVAILLGIIAPHIVLVFAKFTALRVPLWKSGYIPWNYVRFLDYAVERILLRKVGGEYIFVHRMLLEYFAGLEGKQGTSLVADGTGPSQGIEHTN
jgi:hypothetical protein